MNNLSILQRFALSTIHAQLIPLKEEDWGRRGKGGGGEAEGRRKRRMLNFSSIYEPAVIELPLMGRITCYSIELKKKKKMMMMKDNNKLMIISRALYHLPNGFTHPPIYHSTHHFNHTLTRFYPATPAFIHSPSHPGNHSLIGLSILPPMDPPWIRPSSTQAPFTQHPLIHATCTHLCIHQPSIHPPMHILTYSSIQSSTHSPFTQHPLIHATCTHLCIHQPSIHPPM